MLSYSFAECLRTKRVDIPDPNADIYNVITKLTGDSIAGDHLYELCGSPELLRFKEWLHFLERIGRIVVLRATDNIDYWTVILNADYLSKQYTTLRQSLTNGDKMTYDNFRSALPTNLRERWVTFRDLLAKCHFIYDDKKNQEIFFPGCASMSYEIPGKYFHY